MARTRVALAGLLIQACAVPLLGQDAYLDYQAQRIIEQKKQSSDPRERAFAHQWEKNQQRAEDSARRSEDWLTAERRAEEANRGRMLILIGVLAAGAMVATAIGARRQPKCTKCGAQVGPGSKYCAGCGAEINVAM